MTDGNPILIFHRREGFYPIEVLPDVDLAQQAAEHAAVNPGTLAVEDIDGNVLWRLQ